LAFGRLVKVVHVLVDLLRVDRSRLLSAACCDHHVVQTFSLAAEVTLQVAFEGSLVHVLVVPLDGIDVGICAAQEYLVQHSLFGAHATECLAECEAVLLKRTTDDCFETFAEVARSLRVHVFQQVALVTLLERMLHAGNFERTHRCKDLDEGLLVGAKAFHGFTQCIGSSRHVHI
jgi:hypothetical protein